ncbi:hypothetical protein [Billgrantia bachuensis]|uniref:hypothetical protein n=1 Tax=Billgrantia bachuensis TaxID=2717286 RepID=UPI00197D57C8|nr:hypothetical protein [Halomonas bachuensis]
MVKTEILSVRDPQWVDENRTAINCWVRTNTLVQEVPFTATPYDPEPHGRELFARCLAGEFGDIAAPEAQRLPAPMPPAEVPVQLKRLERFLSHANLENARKSFRSVVIVWASFLDGLLDELLEIEALRASAAGEAVGKPPHTFDDRIKRAFAAGLIDQEETDRCLHIRRIRNAAAHDWELSLETESVLPGLRALHEADHSEVLVFQDDLDYLLQRVYSASCAMLIMRLLERLPVEAA